MSFLQGKGFVKAGGGVSGDGTGIDDPAAFLRAARVNGAGSLATIPKKLWRLVSTLHRQTDTAAGFSWPNRVRALTLGDSVACDINSELSGIFGYGGGDALLYAWTRQASPTPTDTNAANYATWSDGVFGLANEFARTINGVVMHLDASFANGTWIERTNIVTPISSVHVGYLSASGFGSFKLQYKANGAGAWTDATTAAVESGGGSQSGGVVNSNNSGAEVYRTATFTLPLPDVYHLRLVATSGRVRLCSAVVNCGAMLTGPAAGMNSISGALSVNMASAGKQLEQHFSLTPQAVWTATLAHFSPHIIVYKSLNGWSLASYQANWPAYAAKIQAAAPNALLVVCGSHPRGAAPENDNAGDLAVDDYLKEWCASQNGALFVDVRQSFPAYDPAYESTTSSADDLWSDAIHIYDLGTHAGGELWVRALVLAELQPAFDYIRTKRDADGYGTVIPVPGHEFRMFDGSTRAGVPVGVQQRLVYTLHPRFPGYQVMRPINAGYNSGTGAFAQESGWGSTGGDSLNPNALVLLNRGQEMAVCGNHIAGTFQGMTFNVAAAATTNLERTRDGYRFRLPVGTFGKKSGFIIEAPAAVFPDTRLFGINRNSTDAAEGEWLWAHMNGGDQQRAGGATTNGSPNISFNSIFFPPHPGQLVTGTGIPAGTRVVSATNTTAVLSANATATNTGLTLTFTSEPTANYYGTTNDANWTAFGYQEPSAPTYIFVPICTTLGTGPRMRAIAVVGSYATKAAGEAAVEVGEVFYDEGTGKTRTRLV